MNIFRSILSLMLVLVATLVVSCGSPQASAPPTYTPEKIEKINTYRIPIDQVRERMPELGKALGQEKWADVSNFIHGPLGFLRSDMSSLSKFLLPEEQEKATVMAKDIFRHLEDIDLAARNKNYTQAMEEYKEVISDLDNYAELIPQKATVAEKTGNA
ncbi:photosystem II protein PsbQ [Myxosarcina sp. GI1]|uniref:photosystem II protein PsbQ n=1 Tax=Myxosarcina sp. GI1 TaxID=1541065 RepID=UPI000563A4CE|nr:photosystem II protein PsbQ [Myxosarcina sp. GI1]